MKAMIKIAMDNAAFKPDCEGAELARILRELADRVDYAKLDPRDEFSLRDVNGNCVGECRIIHRKIK